jgi:hypothetical protein
MTPEGRVKSAIDKLLKGFNAFHHKPVQNGMGKPGLDYWVCHRGFFCAIEAKGPDGHMTDRQVQTALAAHDAKASVFCINTAKSGEIDRLHAWLISPQPGVTGTNFLSEVADYHRRRAKNESRDDRSGDDEHTE